MTWTRRLIEKGEVARGAELALREAGEIQEWHRTVEAEHRRTLIARFYLSGRPVAEIARGLKRDDETLHQAIAAVRLDLTRIRDEWRDSRVRDWNEEKEKHLARIDALEQTYWDAWYRSLEPEERIKTEARESPRATWKIAQTIRNANPVGNMDALAGVERCQQERAKILGLYAPVKVAPTTPDGESPYDPISDQTRLALITAEFIRRGGNESAIGPVTHDDAGRHRAIEGVAVERRPTHPRSDDP